MMKMMARLAAILLAILLAASAGLHVSAGEFSPLRAEGDEDGEDAIEEFVQEEPDPLVTLRGRNMVSDGTYIYYIPQEPTYDYTEYFGVFPADYEDGLPETQTLRRVALPVNDHPLDTEEVIYGGQCEWLCIGDDGKIYFCSYDLMSLMCYDPETEGTEVVYTSPYDYPPSAPYYRDGYLFFVEAGDLMRWECGSSEEAELYFSAWDYSMSVGAEDGAYSFLWEVDDYEFIGDTLYINLSNSDADYERVYRLIAGPASYDDFYAEPDDGDGTETGEEGKSGARDFLSGLIGPKDKGEEEPLEENPEEEETDETDEEPVEDGNSYLAAYGFRMISKQNGRRIAKYQDKLIFVNNLWSLDDDGTYRRDDYGDYLYCISILYPDDMIRSISPQLDTRTMFVAGDYVYYDGYLEGVSTYGTDDGAPLYGRYIFVQSLGAPESEEGSPHLFSIIDNPRQMTGVAGGWLWYEYYENNFWINIQDIDDYYCLSYLEDDEEDSGDDEERDTGEEGDEQGGFVPPENIPGDTGVYGPGTCDLRLESDDQMAAFRLLRTDGTEQFFVILNAYSSQLVTFPCGAYILKTAEGPYWISDQAAFGPDGTYSTTDWFVFEEGYEYYIESDATEGDFEGDTMSGFLN